MNECCAGEKEGRFFLPRRSFLMAAGACAVTGFQVPLKEAMAKPAGRTYQDFWQEPRVLKLYRSETGESGEIEFWRDGQLLRDGWHELMHICRDVRRNVMMHFDPVVINTVWGVQEWVKRDTGKLYTYRLTDGVRHPLTNKETPNAADASWHMKAMALDGRLEGLSLATFAKGATFFGVGGVGVYKTHVHVDSGNVYNKSGGRRTWKG